jgi:hypothetical protein
LISSVADRVFNWSFDVNYLSSTASRIIPNSHRQMTNLIVIARVLARYSKPSCALHCKIVTAIPILIYRYHVRVRYLKAKLSRLLSHRRWIFTAIILVILLDWWNLRREKLIPLVFHRLWSSWLTRFHPLTISYFKNYIL